MAIYGLNHGMHVFMEKPPVIKVQQLEQLKKIKTENKLGFAFKIAITPA